MYNEICLSESPFLQSLAQGLAESRERDGRAPKKL